MVAGGRRRLSQDDEIYARLDVTCCIGLLNMANPPRDWYNAAGTLRHCTISSQHGVVSAPSTNLGLASPTLPGVEGFGLGVLHHSHNYRGEILLLLPSSSFIFTFEIMLYHL
jgi:hypothetical protein